MITCGTIWPIAFINETSLRNLIIASSFVSHSKSPPFLLTINGMSELFSSDILIVVVVIICIVY